MANYRTTVILKTDIVDSTPRLAEQTQIEMGLERKQHKQFIADIASKHGGSVFDQEGDAYWIEFPSVTNACLAAIEMHENLRSTQAGRSEKQRLAIRASITAGDILYQGYDIMGTTMSLTVRIEKLTPPDEIYLSHAAWLMLNKAEVQTSFVGEFNLKGFRESEKLYKVNQRHGIRTLIDQYIVFADAKGFGKFFKSNSIEIIERFLLDYDHVMEEICTDHDGIVRQVNGDLYFLTFTDADKTISAIAVLCRRWETFLQRYNIGLSAIVHKGDLHVFRSYVFGESVNVTVSLSDHLYRLFHDDDIFVAVSGAVKDAINMMPTNTMCQKLDVDFIEDNAVQTLIREYRSYRFVVE